MSVQIRRATHSTQEGQSHSLVKYCTTWGYHLRGKRPRSLCDFQVFLQQNSGPSGTIFAKATVCAAKNLFKVLHGFELHKAQRAATQVRTKIAHTTLATFTQTTCNKALQKLVLMQPLQGLAGNTRQPRLLSLRPRVSPLGPASHRPRASHSGQLHASSTHTPHTAINRRGASLIDTCKL
jgi:hypothetical protein